MFKVITPPVAEPITLEEAKAHLKVEHDDEDALITALIAAARDKAEQFTNRLFMQQTIVQVYESFQEAITAKDGCTQYLELNRTPVQSVSAIRYQPSSTEEIVTLSSADDPATFQTNTTFEPARLFMTNGLPSAAVMGTIEIEYICGWSTAADVPPTIKQAILLMVGHWFEHREDHVKKMPFASECLLQSNRVFTF